MSTTRRRLATSSSFGGIEIELIDAGPVDGDLVVLSHGFPESSYSWRHQIEPLADAGYRVLVPDQRGYARSSAPVDVAAYRSDHLAGDLLALLDDVGADDAVFVGHDWGALLVWDLARYHPDRVRGVINVSVPYTPWPMRPTELFDATWGDRFFYMTYFQQVGPAEIELEEDVERTMRLVLWGASAEMYGPPPDPADLPPADGTGFLSAFGTRREVPEGLPDWLRPADLGVYVEQFEASGFFGPVSWYRNLDADWELTRDLPAPSMPCAFIGGDHDLVIAHRPEYVDSMNHLLDDFRGTTMIEGAGHWTQQERPEQFNAALLATLDRL
ncbi:alpha/beta fold hydrolase [Ilumatobacter sp.]|uniref:alpha/beta fold hydrolase n=1 Tax=Ilumatobacter sp. TaxID=1967498 RepID=UPI003B516709